MVSPDVATSNLTTTVLALATSRSEAAPFAGARRFRAPRPYLLLQHSSAPGCQCLQLRCRPQRNAVVAQLGPARRPLCEDIAIRRNRQTSARCQCHLLSRQLDDVGRLYAVMPTCLQFDQHQRAVALAIDAIDPCHQSEGRVGAEGRLPIDQLGTGQLLGSGRPLGTSSPPVTRHHAPHADRSRQDRGQPPAHGRLRCKCRRQSATIGRKTPRTQAVHWGRFCSTAQTPGAQA